MGGRASNYDDFRKALKIDMLDARGELIFEEKRELEMLMSTKGYRRVRDKDTKVLYNKVPSDKQVEFAWNYLKGIQPPQKIIEDFLKETYNGRDVFRANTRIVINKKVYRKGQFLPKRQQ